MRSLMMKSCSGLAIAGALGMSTGAAQAQSFEATGTFAFGTGNISTGFDETTVIVDTQSAVIDWTPNDNGIGGGEILFQPFGTMALYDGIGDYVVLNRIVPADTSRAILFEGLVTSFNDTGGIGGTLFFYSPGGIIIGQDALFDVGSLGLTTAEPLVDGNGDWFVNDQVVFQQADPASAISIQGGVLQAIEEDSFIALFAPTISQRGEVFTNGQAALVAGEAGTITFSPDGLFDIEVTVGTDGGIDHTGITGGPESSGPGDNHRVFMVAVPKANAINMAIFGGSDIGFDVAGGAANDGDAVVLSAGFNVTDGLAVPDNTGGGAAVDLNIFSREMINTNPEPILFRSATQGFSSGQIQMDIASDLFLDASAEFYSADRIVAVARDIGGSLGNIVALGDLFLSADDIGLSPSGLDVQGVTFDVGSGASLNVAGDLLISARGGADSNGDGNASAGQALLRVFNAGSAQIGGDLILASDSAPTEFFLSANATANESQIIVSGAGSNLDVDGVTRLFTNAEAEGTFNATAGTSLIIVDQGGVFTTGELNMLANARTLVGSGTAQGGFAQITVDGDDSVLTVESPNQTGDPMAGELDFMAARALGGSPDALANLNGGEAIGGQATLIVSNGGDLILQGSNAMPLAINLNATGGDASANNTSAGAATGGLFTLDIQNSTVNLRSLALDVSATGGSALGGLTNVNGGAATGGSTFFVFDTATASLAISDYLNNTLGGDASSDVDGLAGIANGGAVSFFSVGSDVTFTRGIDLLSFVEGGMGGIGGPATGSSFNFSILDNSTINFQGGFLARSIARAGRGLAADSTIGANGTSQPIDFVVADSTVSANGFIDLRNQANGGNADGSQGGDGLGNDIRVRLNNATIVANTLSLNTFAAGGGANGTFTNTASGTGTSGNALIVIEGGVVDIQAGVTAISRAQSFGSLGGTAAADSTAGIAEIDGTLGTSTTITGAVNLFSQSTVFASGNASAGDAFAGGSRLISNGGDITIEGTLRLNAQETAQGGISAGNAMGTAVAEIIAQDANITVTGPTTIDTVSRGGNAADGPGGSAAGVAVQVIARNGQIGSAITLNSLTIDSIVIGGNGGNGGAGGDASGGSIQLLAEAQNAELSVLSFTEITTDITAGNGGDGDTGGDGGFASNGVFNIGTISGGQFPDALGSALFRNIDIIIDANGGNGGEGTAGAGGRGGDAFAGSGDLIGRGAPVTLFDFTADMTSTGGNGGVGTTTQGNGGDALAGGVDLVFSNNFGGNTRGDLTARDVTIVADAIAGQGGVDGLAFASNFSSINFGNADGTIRNVNYSTSGIMADGTQEFQGNPASTAPTQLIFINGNVSVEAFNFTTPRDVSVLMDTATLDTTSTLVNVGSFVLEPTTNGGALWDAFNTLSITSAGDIVFDTALESGGLMTLVAGGDIAIGAVEAFDMVVADAQGLLSITQDWSATGLELTSSDIALGNGVQLLATDVVTLVTRNPGGMTIGAGLDPSTGYVVNDTMLGQIDAPIINFSNDPSLSTSIIVEDIDLGAAPSAEIVNFTALGNSNLRIEGNVTSTALDPLNLGLIGPLVQINSDTGSVDLLANGGTIFVEGGALHVGEVATLDTLLIDNLTDQEIADLLSTPTAITRADGVLSAPFLTLQLSSEILIQNTGTAEIPAGSLTTLDGSAIVIPANNPQDVLVILNGQLDEPGGVLTGDEAATALIDFNSANNPNGFDGYAANSTFNGCPLTGCVAGPAEPEPPVVPEQQQNLTATVSAEVQVVNEAPVLTTPATSENAADIAADANLAGTSGSDAGGAMGEAMTGEVDVGSPNDDFAFEDDPLLADSSSDDASSGSTASPASGADEAGESNAPVEDQTEDEVTADEEEIEATEEEEAEEAEEAATSGPIMPPVSLFSTRSLDNAVDINDPVASAGNPALLDPDVAPPSADAGEVP